MNCLFTSPSVAERSRSMPCALRPVLCALRPVPLANSIAQRNQKPLLTRQIMQIDTHYLNNFNHKSTKSLILYALR